VCLSPDYPIITGSKLPRSVIGYKVVDNELRSWFKHDIYRIFRYVIGKTHRTKHTPGFSVFENLADAKALRKWIVAKSFWTIMGVKPYIIKVRLTKIGAKGTWIFYPSSRRYSVYEGNALKVLEIVK